MRIDEVHEALTRGDRLRAAWGHPPNHSETRAEGRVIGYSRMPMVLIQTDDGEQVWWGIELMHATTSPCEAPASTDAGEVRDE